MSFIIKVNNLSYSISKRKILDNISIDISENSIVGIIGTNSSGKTSLLKMLSGDLNNKNTVIFNYAYVDSKKFNNDFIKIGRSFTDDKFLFDDVYKELIFPLENLCYDSEVIQFTVKKLVDYFECSYLLDKKIIDLKEEEKTIVRLLLSLVHTPKVVIIDEPFKYMGNSLKNKFIDKLFTYVKENGITLIIATSNTEDVLLTDYLYVLDNGQIVMEGNTLDVLNEDDNLKKMGIDLPFMVDLSSMLKFYEILDDTFINMEELVNKLWR